MPKFLPHLLASLASFLLHPTAQLVLRTRLCYVRPVGDGSWACEAPAPCEARFLEPLGFPQRARGGSAGGAE